MRLAIASDHAAFDLKQRLVETLQGWGHEVLDLGPHDDGARPILATARDAIRLASVLHCASARLSGAKLQDAS